MRSTATLVSVLVLLATSVAGAQTPNHPRTHSPEGGTSLPLVGLAERVHLLGVQRLYGVAVYAESPINDSRLASAETAKAIRVEITYENDLRRQVTIDWRRELIPPLDGRAIVQLRGTFAALQRGDIVVIEYTPSRGTSIRVNKGVAVSGIDHDLMLAFLDHWLGQRPVSEEIKRALLGGSE
jgi:hypothetical protein